MDILYQVYQINNKHYHGIIRVVQLTLHTVEHVSILKQYNSYKISI